MLSVSLTFTAIATNAADEDRDAKPSSAQADSDRKGNADEQLPDGTLAAVVKRLNDEADAHPESRGTEPLSVEEVLAAIEGFDTEELFSPNKLTAEELATLKDIDEKAKLPENVTIRQFVRYHKAPMMHHGRWVRLLVERESRPPFVLVIRNESQFERPFTQFERMNYAQTQRRGGTMLLNRLVTFFKEDVQFDKPVDRTVAYDPLAEQIRKLIATKDVEGLMKLVHWEGIATENALRRHVRGEWEAIVERESIKIEIVPRRFTGTLKQQQAFQVLGPNLPVEAYIVVTSNGVDSKPGEKLWLEAGAFEERPMLVAHKVVNDMGPAMMGKRLSGNLSMFGGYNMLLDRHSLEASTQVTAPEELKAIRQANFELRRVPLGGGVIRAIVDGNEGVGNRIQPSVERKQKLTQDRDKLRIIVRLKRTEDAIENLAVTTDYIKLQKFMLPVDEPVRMRVATQAVVETRGKNGKAPRAWNDSQGQQVSVKPDGKSVELRDGRWQGAFDGEVARKLQGGAFASLNDVLTWHGIPVLHFTTHYFDKPVSTLLSEKEARVVRHEQFDGRRVVVMDTKVSKANRKYRFWIDQERSIVVRRAALVRVKDDQPFQEYTFIESTGHKEIAPGIWLPMKVKYESVEPATEERPRQLSWSYEGTNRDWKVNQRLEDSQFTLEFPDGAIVNDHRSKRSD